jgi:putative YphP/YqiW family bacilliredoxin
MYDSNIVAPMRAELTTAGFTELRSSAEVDQLFSSKPETLLLVINSVCGCAAGAARPGVRKSLQSDKRPSKLATVFAGQDKDATDRARNYIKGYPPSSPAVALFKDGDLVFMLPRHEIEGASVEQIAEKLSGAYERFC